MNWSEFVFFSYEREDKQARLTLTNFKTGKKVSLHPEALAQYVHYKNQSSKKRDLRFESFEGQLVEHGFISDFQNLENKARIEHWWNRGWWNSLEFYLSSRQVPYLDRIDPDGEKRRQALRQYLEDEGGPPSRVHQDTKPEIVLSEARPLPQLSLGNTLLKRRSIRKFDLKQVCESDVSSLLFYGLRKIRHLRQKSEQDGHNDPLVYLKSYGIAFDFYLVSCDVAELESRAYAYSCLGHGLTPLQEPQANIRDKLLLLLNGNRAPLTASFVLFIVADFDQYHWRYRHNRALRNLFIDAGRVAQELILPATALGLGSFCTPAIRESEVCQFLSLPQPRFCPIYSISFGHIAHV